MVSKIPTYSSDEILNNLLIASDQEPWFSLGVVADRLADLEDRSRSAGLLWLIHQRKVPRECSKIVVWSWYEPQYRYSTRNLVEFPLEGMNSNQLPFHAYFRDRGHTRRVRFKTRHEAYMYAALVIGDEVLDLAKTSVKS